MRKDSPLLLFVAGCLSITATAAAQMAPPLETSALLANPRLSPEARQAIQERVDAVHAEFRASHGGLSPEQFGVQCCQITQFPAAAFTPWGLSAPWQVVGLNGYIYPTDLFSFVWVPVSLPSGVQIFFLDLYFYDDTGSGDIVASLQAYYGGTPSSGAPGFAELAASASVGNSGYGYASSPAFSYTVNNNVGYDPAAAQLAITVGAEPGGLGFKAVDLWWMRQVSPAPATASFSDVPTGHPYFQFVEALAAAGITGGCGGSPPRYCVDAPLTRGQMAVFLAKALGLYWPH